MAWAGRAAMIVTCLIVFLAIVGAYAVGYLVARERYLPIARSEYARGIEDGKEMKMLDCYRDPASSPEILEHAADPFVDHLVDHLVATVARGIAFHADIIDPRRARYEPPGRPES